jgi:hypothetical protein
MEKCGVYDITDNYMNCLEQGWVNYGPLKGSVRPAEGLENAKKIRFQKTFVRT